MLELVFQDETLFTALALAMALSADSFFAGFTLNSHTQLGRPHPLIAHRNAFLFGLIQGLLLWIGYKIGSSPALAFLELADVQSLDHWIAFGILAIIAIKFFIESKKEDDCPSPISTPKSLSLVFWMALATSLDALGVGIGIGLLLEASIVLTFKATLVGIVTYIFVFLAQRIAGRLPNKLKPKLQIASSFLLMSLGIKILFDHGVFVFS